MTWYTLTHKHRYVTKYYFVRNNTVCDIGLIGYYPKWSFYKKYYANIFFFK